jgi:hypothetical protein
LTLRRIRRTSDAYDTPLTSCSIPYTDLRAKAYYYELDFKTMAGQLRPANE